jgi:hypothetical protein
MAIPTIDCIHVLLVHRQQRQGAVYDLFNLVTAKNETTRTAVLPGWSRSNPTGPYCHATFRDE